MSFISPKQIQYGESFSNELNFPQLSKDTSKKVSSGPFFPLACFGGWIFGWNGPIIMEADEMVQPDRIKKLK